jgi:hypothetical protein
VVSNFPTQSILCLANGATVFSGPFEPLAITQIQISGMRNIAIEDETYAAIWADRQRGEENEDAIIRRKFGIGSEPRGSTKIGFRDPRSGIELPEGFEIFRTYKGTGYQAKAVNGRWILQSNGIAYRSLNQLNKAVSGNMENAWNNWYFRYPSGLRRLITELRKPRRAPLEPVKRQVAPLGPSSSSTKMRAMGSQTGEPS